MTLTHQQILMQKQQQAQQQAQQHAAHHHLGGHAALMIHNPPPPPPPPSLGLIPPPLHATSTSTSGNGSKPKPQSKYVRLSSLEQAKQLGAPTIHPLHAPQKEIWLKQTTSPKSQLSNIARRNLYCDYLFLLGKVAIGKLGSPTDVSSAALKYDSKKLEQLYQCSADTVQRVIRRGQTSDSTDSRPRTGRKRHKLMMVDQQQQ